MIPTLLLIGLLVGRWAAVPLCAIGWVLVLLLWGTLSGPDIPAAAALATANAAAGVLLHQLGGVAWRRLRAVT